MALYLKRNTEIVALEFTEQQVAMVNLIARSNRFENRTTAILYPDNEIDKLKNLVKSIRFIQIITSSIPDNDISSKLKEYLVSIESLNKEALHLLERGTATNNFNRFRVKTNIHHFLIDNIEKITEIMDFVVPLGVGIREYDPSASQGYS